MPKRQYKQNRPVYIKLITKQLSDLGKLRNGLSVTYIYMQAS